MVIINEGQIIAIAVILLISFFLLFIFYEIDFKGILIISLIIALIIIMPIIFMYNLLNDSKEMIIIYNYLSIILISIFILYNIYIWMYFKKNKKYIKFIDNYYLLKSYYNHNLQNILFNKDFKNEKEYLELKVNFYYLFKDDKKLLIKNTPNQHKNHIKKEFSIYKNYFKMNPYHLKSIENRNMINYYIDLLNDNLNEYEKYKFLKKNSIYYLFVYIRNKCIYLFSYILLLLIIINCLFIFF